MSVAACPGCLTVDETAATARAAEAVPTHHLVLPGIHCAACISGVEKILTAQPGVSDARVNLSRKRVAITAAPNADPSPWIDALAQKGFEAHEADTVKSSTEDDYLIHLGVAGFAMMNVMLCSVAIWSGAEGATRDFLHWVSAAIALPAAAFSAQPFFRSAWPALRAGRLNMDVPISLAIALACAMSLYEITHGGEDAWFDAALSLTFFLLAGRVLDQRLRRAARSAADDLTALEPSRVTCIVDGQHVSRPVEEVAIGDILHLTAGARVPVDATLISGSASIDASALTGESDPVSREKGAAVHAGEVLLDGPHRLRATRVGEDTTLRRLAQLVATAESARGKMRGLADQAAAIYTPAVHIISFGAFLAWYLATGDIRQSLNVAVATLIITCPCALGLAVPAVAVAATGSLFRAGLFVRSDTALERFARIDTVVFDKTGTLTSRAFAPPSGLTPQQIAALRSLAAASDHPICRDLSKQLSDVPAAKVTDISERLGQGVTGTIDGIPVALLGNENGQTLYRYGDTEYVLASEERLLPGAVEVVRDLQDQGMHVWMLTGDKPENAARIAEALNITHVQCELRPEGKLAAVQSLEASGARVLMVGDGLNDTAALAVATASMAPGTALDASRNAADVVAVSNGVPRIAPALALARRARQRILQNFALALCYNAIAVPIAVLGFASPLAAAIAMSTSSITVVLNAQRGTRI